MPKKTKISSFALDPELAESLREAADKLGKSMSELIREGLRTQLEYGDDGRYPVATVDLVMADTVPLILTGRPGIGKTYWVKGLVESLEGPVLVLDLHDEYDGSEFKKIRMLDVGGIDFKKDEGKYRVVAEAFVDPSYLFMNLLNTRERLKRWVIVIEEGHRFLIVTKFGVFVQKALLDLIAEARKYTRKLIIVSQQGEPFKDLGKIMRVRKWEDTKE